jgi:septal ring factor EnvC (AmiA/AmiB activator)
MFHKFEKSSSDQTIKQTLPLSALHRPVFESILPNMLDERTLAAFSRTSRLFSHYSQRELEKKKLQKFLNHVIRSEQAQAEEMLKSLAQIKGNHASLRRLLLQVGRVKDYSNRTIEGSAFRLALGAEDVKYHENEECMAEMLARYTRLLPDGEAILQAQYAEQIP